MMRKNRIWTAHQFIRPHYRLKHLLPPGPVTSPSGLHFGDLGAILFGIPRSDVAHITIFLNCYYVHHAVVHLCKARRCANGSRVEYLALVDDGADGING